MKYRMNHNAPFCHTGVILNCADGSKLEPNDYVFQCYFKRLDNGEEQQAKVSIQGKQVTFTANLDVGVYDWVTILHHKADMRKAWQAPTVLVEVE